jgi:hypothetical protein
MLETAIKYLAESDDGVETIPVGDYSPALVAPDTGGVRRWLLPARPLADERGRSRAVVRRLGDLFGEGLKAIAVTLAYFAVLLTAVLASLLIASPRRQ